MTINWGELARPAHRFMAFNKLTGESAWMTSTTPLPEDTTYMRPLLKVVGGQQLLLACWRRPASGVPTADWQTGLELPNFAARPTFRPWPTATRSSSPHSEENIDRRHAEQDCVRQRSPSWTTRGPLTDKNVIWNAKSW